jgi:DnaJ-class molecular chaperone
MFDYDGWLESPYTDESGCDESCPVCFTECENCNGAGTLDDKEACPDCKGEGGFFDPQSKSEHRDYHEGNETPEDK